jgi:MYXO-CTERM domain-containing protein
LQNPTYLSQLVGAFANSSGVVVGAPFALGDAATIEVAPVGATQLLLGVNDDIYSDNSGSLLVQVSGPSAVSAAPEPGAWLLMLLGVGAIGLVLRRAKTAFDSGLSGVSAA